jgi:hypothetical protein
MNAAEFTLTTNDIARIMGVRPTSIVSAVSKFGSYHNVVPLKMPSGHLRWPSDSRERLLGQAYPKQAAGAQRSADNGAQPKRPKPRMDRR